MTVTIATTSPVFCSDVADEKAFSKRGWHFRRLLPLGLTGPDLTRETLRLMNEYAEETDILSVGLAPVSAEYISKAINLKGIVKFGVGVDNIDINAATKRKIPVVNAPGANSNAVAELTLCFILELSRRVWQAHNNLIQGRWIRNIGCEIQGKILGIIGLGSIGKLVALKAQALGMTVLAVDPYPDIEFSSRHGISLCSLEEVLNASDYVSIHSVGGEKNRNMIDMKQLLMMKPTAFLMNMSRGELVNETALTAALQKGIILGAGLDAFSEEPPNKDNELLKLPNVICSPHLGAHTKEAQRNVQSMNIADIECILSGKKPKHCINSTIYN